MTRTRRWGWSTSKRSVTAGSSSPASGASARFLGLGIQGNQGRLERRGPFYPGHGLDRIVAYHERQERRYAQTAAALAVDTGKPVLCATELAMGDASNPAVAGVRESGKLCHPSADRAVTALAHLWRYARWRRRRGL